MKLAEIAQNGDNLETLRALRQRIAEAIDATTSGRDCAALSRQLQIILERIADLEGQRDEDDPIASIINDQGLTRIRGLNRRPLYDLEDEDMIEGGE